MVNIRHTGIYVCDLEKEKTFFTECFRMIPICNNNLEENLLLDDLFKQKNTRIITSKLITEMGEQNKTGDMIELIKVVSLYPDKNYDNEKIFTTGVMHIGIGVDNIEKTCDLVSIHGGKIMTKIHEMQNGNKCAFVKDPEGNWIEIIQNKKI